MRWVSINGAVFMFMARGEKLQKQHLLPRDNLPDQRYVLWPRGEWWDVRYLDVMGRTREWLPIADKPFCDESAAWLAALAHWEKAF